MLRRGPTMMHCGREAEVTRGLSGVSVIGGCAFSSPCFGRGPSMTLHDSLRGPFDKRWGVCARGFPSVARVAPLARFAEPPPFWPDSSHREFPNSSPMSHSNHLRRWRGVPAPQGRCVDVRRRASLRRSGRHGSPDRARRLWAPASSRSWRPAARTRPHSAVRPPEPGCATPYVNTTAPPDSSDSRDFLKALALRPAKPRIIPMR